MTTIVSQCYWCKHYEGEGKCKAFREMKIPSEVFFNIHDHKEPYFGDNDIQFEPKKEGEIPTLHSPEDKWPTSE